jgi:electron transfer flavoprotein alpha subunit
MSILVILENNGDEIKKSSLSTLCAGLEIKEKTDLDLDVFMASENLEETTQKLKALAKVRKAITAEGEVFKGGLAESVSKVLLKIASDYEYIIAPATTYGKNILPRVSALLDVQQISDVTKIIDKDTFSHPIYAGNIIASVKTSDEKKLLTIRDTAFDAFDDFSGDVEIVSFEEKIENEKSQFIKKQESKSERPDLTVADIVVSGGKGVKDKEGFKLVEDLADKLGAAVGATRAVVDDKIVPNELQVGQTGKVVAPKLYIAAGISGAIQHIAGMRDSKTVIAINKDEEAPIFDYSDYGFVGELEKIIPQILEKL